MNCRVKIAGLLILYNPSGYTVRKNIETYIEYLDKLIIIDNTNTFSQLNSINSLWHRERIEYFAMGKNNGLATALNIGSSMALGRGFDWLMLIDQDSSASSDMMDLMLESIGKFSDCGILAPLQITKTGDYVAQNNEYTDILFTMTSGSILNLKAYQKCGPFEDRLFIDHVDHEYCLRLNKMGYKIIQCNKAVLKHSLGEIKDITLFGYKYAITTHKPFRLYFFTRNGIYVALKYLFDYPSFFIYFCLQLGKNIFKAVFIEENKIDRLTMIYAGISDFFTGRYGKRFI
jgi:rhamnosyltransferase